jgi:abortive infection bacteriophage resistance protein
MSSKHNKPHLPFEQQLALLKKRELEITEIFLEYPISVGGYYRLSAYLHPLRTSTLAYCTETLLNCRRHQRKKTLLKCFPELLDSAND